MCMCGKPTVNGEQGYSWDGKTFSVRKPAPPETKEDDTVLFDEPGRCGGLDSHCHHYIVVKQFGSFDLLVRNGSGDQRFRLSNGKAIVESLGLLTSNERYWILNAIYHAHSDGKSNGIDTTNARWRKAAAEKRIKTRKIRNQDAVKVWIEPQTV